MKSLLSQITEPERDLIIRSLARDGRTVRQTAEIVNRTERAIRLVAKARGLSIPRAKIIPRQFRNLSLEIPARLMVELEKAADRRDLEPHALAVLILTGVIGKGSISRTLAGTQI
jgi:hypothetical protein